MLGRHARVVVGIEPPTRVTHGWSVRARVRNDGPPATFRVELLEARGASFARVTLPRTLCWRDADAPDVNVERGGTRIARLVVLDTDRNQFRCSFGPDGGHAERQISVSATDALVLRIRVTGAARADVVRNVRVARDVDAADGRPVVAMVGDDELPPAVREQPARPAVATVGDQAVLPAERREPARPTTASDRIVEEARRFGDQDNAALRGATWNALPYFRDRVVGLLDLNGIVTSEMKKRDRPVALTLACGDMSGEYGFFKRAGISEIDASDISEGQRAKFFEHYDGAIPVNYTIGDANQIELEPQRYDLVYLQHAYHHVEALEHVADQIVKALKPDGIFAINDYIGANFLQRTPRQRALCGAIWDSMPQRYRVGANGKVVGRLRIPAKHTLPPYEAVRSEEILQVLTERFEARHLVTFGGILFPLFNGFVHCYTDSDDDQAFLRVMWDLDQWLIRTGAIEPNFIKAVFVPRP